jgi:hypothetical protein
MVTSGIRWPIGIGPVVRGEAIVLPKSTEVWSVHIGVRSFRVWVGVAITLIPVFRLRIRFMPPP